MAFQDELQDLIDKETRMTGASAKMARFSYEQSAYDNDTMDGVAAFDENAAQNIPLGSSETYLDVNSTVVDKGLRSDAAVFPRNLANHFFGRASYNLNKIHDWMKDLLTKLKGALGAANGIATLDANARIPYSQLPESAMEYKGTWDASTNAPQLDNNGSASNVNGYFYVVSVAGSHDFGAGAISFDANDRVICTGSGADSVWSRLSGGTLPASKGDSTHPIYIDANSQVQVGSAYAGGTKMTVNGGDAGAGESSIYAPTSAGSASKIPYMTSSSEWSWIAAPTAGGMVLKSGSSSPYAPFWGNASVAWGGITGTISNQTDLNTELGKKSGVKLNGSSSISSTASFYAPTSAGTSGHFLKSNGYGAPSWASVPTTSAIVETIPSSTSSETFGSFDIGEMKMFIIDWTIPYNTSNYRQLILPSGGTYAVFAFANFTNAAPSSTPSTYPDKIIDISSKSGGTAIWRGYNSQSSNRTLKFAAIIQRYA